MRFSSQKKNIYKAFAQTYNKWAKICKTADIILKKKAQHFSSFDLTNCGREQIFYSNQTSQVCDLIKNVFAY